MKWKLITVVLVLTVAALSPAPIKDPRQGVAPMPERTQEQLTLEQQKFNGTQGPIGTVPRDTDQTYAPRVESSGQARTVLGQATQQQQQATPDNAQQVLREAEAGLKREKPGFPWFGALFFMALGVGAVMMVRVWANKNIPEYKPPRQVRW